MRNSIPFLLLALLLTAAQAQNLQRDLVREAEAGNVSAELKLGRAYQYGNGVPRDVQQAIHWFQKAVHDGSGEAAYTLGTLAYNGDVLGDTIQESLEQAWACFEIARVMNYPDAAQALTRIESEMTELRIEKAHELAASMFLEGNITAKNFPAALQEIEWLQQHGSSSAKLLMGTMYRTGDGVPKDLTKAQEFCSEALKMKAAGAGFCLGKIFEEQGDQRAAFNSFEKEAHAGLVSAILELAQRLKEGRGTKPNVVEALAWVMRAESGGAAGAVEMRAKFSEGLSEKQVSEAKKKARALKVTSAAPPPLRTSSSE